MTDAKIQPRFRMWLVGLVLAFVLGALWWGVTYLRLKSVTSFAQCQTFPGAITQLTFPGTCRLPDGRTFTQPMTNDVFRIH